jgi:small subunit ribosomal protein S7
MSRRNKPEKRTVQPDARFSDERVTRFINRMMLRGKKSVSERIFYNAMETLEKRVKDAKPLDVFHQALKNATPLVEVKARRVGGSTYQVPLEVRGDRGFGIACQNIIKFSRGRSGKNMAICLADELMAAYNNEGASVKKKDETHRMAEASRAFAHYRF